MKTWEGDEDANLEECKLLSGQFAALLQVLLGFIALSVLVAKRLRETPRRPLAVWAFDASKQMIGAGFAHVANLLIAILLYSYEDAHADSDQEVDQCAFYFVNFALDTSFGVFLNFIFLEAFSMLAQRFGWVSVMTPGDYGDPVRVRPWLLQLVSWIGVIFTTKFVISLFILALEKPLGDFAVWLFTPLQAYPDVELAVVMIACPCLMNALQFWIQDSFLKKDVRDESILVDAASASPSTLAATKKLGTPSDEETDGREDEDDEATTVVVISGKDKGKTKAKKDSETKSKKDTELKATAG